ncbi:hypothetical protein [Methylomonas methanica]|uniref:hypothetical protein n=1 Tax=Methylomonas methanica TaxID=421 RepID=UPI0002D383F0|nr:hypothetical protein [Methylomonas methanica]
MKSNTDSNLANVQIKAGVGCGEFTNRTNRERCVLFTACGLGKTTIAATTAAEQVGIDRVVKQAGKVPPRQRKKL